MGRYIKELPEDAREIPNSLNWVDPNGNVYGIETRVFHLKNGKIAKHKHYGEYFIYNQYINNHNGYVYCSIKYFINKEKTTCKNRQRRVHILVAEAFLENPNAYPIVGHKNNIKSDNRVENLYWTTYKENTQKAVDDGLLVNAVGYEDSQSKPVVVFNTYTNEEIGRYGSASEAERKFGAPMTTILRQAKYKKPVRKPYYFRFQCDADLQAPTIIIQYNFETDEEIGRYWNTWEAERKTGICSKVISDQCKRYCKPQWTKSGTYFQYSKTI